MRIFRDEVRAFWNLGTVTREEAMQAVQLSKEGHFTIVLRRLDGHWCDISFREAKPGTPLTGVHFSVELDDSKLVALEEWLTQ
jgi:hypothetical protein